MSYENIYALQAMLVDAVKHGHNKSGILQLIEKVLEQSTSLTSRYCRINVIKMLQDNTKGGVLKLAELMKALEILEKYGKNLLRSDRPPQWRTVRISNAVFHNKVDNVQGSRDILKLMGYTESVYDGLAFPQTAIIPELNSVASVTADIVLLKHELAMLQKGIHPRSDDFGAYTPHFGSAEETLQIPTKGPMAQTWNTVHTTGNLEPMDPVQQPSMFDGMCDVCGQKQVEFQCDICKKRQCRECDKIWHQNRNRVHHHRVKLSFYDESAAIGLLGTSSSHRWPNTSSVQDIPSGNGHRFSETPQTNGGIHTPSYSNAKPGDKPSEEVIKWEDRIAQKAIEFLEIENQLIQQQCLVTFCSEVYEQIEKYRNGAGRLKQSSSVLSKHLLERASALEEQVNELKKLFATTLSVAEINTENANSLDSPKQNVFVNPPQTATENIESTLTYMEDCFQLVHFENPAVQFKGPPTNDYCPSFSMTDQSGLDRFPLNSTAIDSGVIKPNLPKHALPAGSSILPSTISTQPGGSMSFMSLRELEAYAEREDVRIKCMEMVDSIREAEGCGYTLKHVQVAMKELNKHKYVMDSPASWLKTNWQDKVSQLMEQTTLPSSEDASRLLMLCNGSVHEAREMLIEDVSNKMKKVHLQHLIDDKRIQEAILATPGDFNQMLIALQTPLVKEFHERLDEQEFDNAQITINNLLAMEDKLHMQHALVAAFSIESEAIAVMMCALLPHCSSSNTSDSEEEEASVVLTNCDLDDVVEAAQSFPDNLDGAVKYLKNRCMLCLETFARSKVECMTTCSDNECKYCHDCLTRYLQFKIKEGHIRDIVCPVCKLPDMDGDEETTTNYFNYLDVVIRTRLDDDCHALFQQKLRDQTLMKMPNFRWCSHCTNGFLYEYDEENLKMVCSSCRKATCYNCKKPWEEQHEGISCQAFLEWKQLNDPDFQAAGLAAHLKENGIDCPNCKFRYALAKGGCIHFKCLMCSFQFCSGCKRPFKQGRTCTTLASCSRLGLHAHHPRDCLFYLRDFEVEQLQKILDDAAVAYDTTQVNTEAYCQVLEQKETSTGLVDDVCGRQTAQNHAGLCVLHYKEYLVNLINDKQLDPASIFTFDEMLACLKRCECNIPDRDPDSSDDEYRELLLSHIRHLSLTNERE